MILLNRLTKRFGPKILFENVGVQFDPKKRYGITGANGAGKSTLLKVLSGLEDTDAGSVTIPSGLRLGVLKQNHFEYDQERILDAVLMGNQALFAALSEKERLLQGEITNDVGMRLAELEGVIAEENGYVAESEAAELLTGLGFPISQHEQTMGSLPSGYKLRVLLAQVLFGNPDVLLLDEPTNHLDLDSIRWLEQFLLSYRGTLLIVSHDRHFLDSVATHIADIDYKTITIYTGNYSRFLEAKYENQQQAVAQTEASKKKIADLQGFVQRFGSHASKSKQAQSRVKQIEKLEESLEQKGVKRSSLVRPFVRFEFDKASGRDVVRLEGVDKAFGDKVIFQDLALGVSRGERIAITGVSGIGKSTLLKLLVGAVSNLDADTKTFTLLPDRGNIRWGSDTSVGYFAQDHHEAIGETAKGQTAFEWLYSFDKDAAQETIRSILGRLLFSGDDALKQAHTLSGGEAARLLLCKLILGKHNVLVLDEPTNHLDLESIEGLLEGLLLFKGTILVVSHDRHFISRLATRVLELKPGKVMDFNTSYEEFLEKKSG